MQEDFHYYATYCAAFMAGYSHEESQDICYSAQLVDLFSRTFLTKIKGPLSAATTQLQLELMNARTDKVGIQDITRIWASFHFLPGDLCAERKKATKTYLEKYRLICGPNSDLLEKTVHLAKGKSLQAAGIAMHVLADTWAHRYFAGTPSLVINNTDSYFYEIMPDGEERQLKFRHSVSAPDDVEESIYTCSLFQDRERSIMNLGHGRAGHLPDYSYIKYKYMPAWGDYEEIIKDNPSDYMHAYTQMIHALKYLRGINGTFERDIYDMEAIAGLEEAIDKILRKRQSDASEDWKNFGEWLSGREIEKFDLSKYEQEYVSAKPEDKDNTFLGKFAVAALSQKSMVTHSIFSSGNRLAGYSVDYEESGFKGIKDFKKLINGRGGEPE